MKAKTMENNVNGGGAKSSLNNFQGPNIIGLCFAYKKCM